MSIQKKLRILCLTELGCKAEPWDNVWDEIKELAEAFGERRVVEAFSEWAEVKKGEMISRPIGEFSRVAPGLCTGTVQLRPKGDLFALLNELAAIGDNRVLFNREQQAAVGRLMAEHSPADIKSAFQEFWGNIENDDFSVRQAAKTFTEAAEQLLAVQARRRAKEKQTQELLRVSTEAEQKKAASELAVRMKADDELDALIEDSLPQ
jgi:hypothetical protein